MPLPTPYVSKCGRVLFFYTGGLPPTAVPSPPPTVSVNGNPVPLAAPYWDANTKYQPWIAFALPAPVLATDVVTYDLPAGWMSTSKGPAAASSGTADNFTGQLEPGFSGITPTMKLGVNVIGP